MTATLWPDVIGRLLRGEDLPSDLVEQAMSVILQGEATDAQIAGFAVALRAKGESPSELATLVRTMLRFAERVDLEDAGPLLDTCGTGGDRAGTVNVSTMAALVAAAAGAKVAKHGGRAASSKCGSADVLEALGVVIDLGPDGVARSVREVGIGFCFAPRYHAGLRFAAPARRELGTPTTFNFVAPLANPAGVKRQIVGVSDPAMAERLIAMLADLGTERAMVFYGHDGLDELTVTTTSTIHELRNGDISVYDIDPTDFGIPLAEPGGLAGGDAAGNAEAVHKTLAGASGPIRDIVSLNAAAALVVADLASDLGHGVQRAHELIDDGAAAATLESLVRVTVACGVRGHLMAQALECPACGMRHRLDGLVPESTFRCERCGQKLLVPAIAAAPPRNPSPGAVPTAATAAAAGAVAPPPRRSGVPPVGGTPTGRTAVAGGAAAGVTVTLPAAGEAPPRVPPDSTAVRGAQPGRRKAVAWYWRLLAWVVAVPLGFVLAVLPSYELGLISKDDVLDVFVGSGADRYVRLAIVTLIWAVVTALLVQLFVEGGRWWARRRRRSSRGDRPRDSAVPVAS